MKDHPLIGEYLELEEWLDHLLAEVSRRIAGAVSDTVKVPIMIPGNCERPTGTGATTAVKIHHLQDVEDAVRTTVAAAEAFIGNPETEAETQRLLHLRTYWYSKVSMVTNQGEDRRKEEERRGRAQALSHTSNLTRVADYRSRPPGTETDRCLKHLLHGENRDTINVDLLDGVHGLAVHIANPTRE